MHATAHSLVLVDELGKTLNFSFEGYLTNICPKNFSRRLSEGHLNNMTVFRACTHHYGTDP